MIRKIHIRTYKYLAKRKASTNPLAYCQGGFYGGNLKPEEKIKSILKPMTISFGEQDYQDGVDLSPLDFYEKLNTRQKIKKNIESARYS